MSRKSKPRAKDDAAKWMEADRDAQKLLARKLRVPMRDIKHVPFGRRLQAWREVLIDMRVLEPGELGKPTEQEYMIIVGNMLGAMLLTTAVIDANGEVSLRREIQRIVDVLEKIKRSQPRNKRQASEETIKGAELLLKNTPFAEIYRRAAPSILGLPLPLRQNAKKNFRAKVKSYVKKSKKICE